MSEPADGPAAEPFPQVPEVLPSPLVRGATLDHVAVAVRSLAEGAALFRDVLGGEFLMGAEQPRQRFRFVQYRFPGGGKVELVSPTGDGFLSRFLERRGEGVHHVTLKVTAIEEQVRRLEAAGIPIVRHDFSNPGWKEAFIHPRHAHGVLVQIAESAHDEEESVRHLRELFSEGALLAP